MESTDNNQRLKRHLILSPPSESRLFAPINQLTRLRNIYIPWDSLLNITTDANLDSVYITELYEMFEAPFFGQLPPKYNRKNTTIKRYQNPRFSLGRKKKIFPDEELIKIRTIIVVDRNGHDEGLLKIIHIPSGREYYLIDAGGSKISSAVIGYSDQDQTGTTYEMFWNLLKKIVYGIKLVGVHDTVPVTESLTIKSPTTSLIPLHYDLSNIHLYYISEYTRIKNLIDISKSVIEKLLGKEISFDVPVPKELQLSLDEPERVYSYIEKIAKLRGKYIELEKERDSLLKKLQELHIKHLKNGEVAGFSEGFYRESEEIRLITNWYTRGVYLNLPFGIRIRVGEQRYSETINQKYKTYKKADEDRIEEEIKFLSDEGYNIYYARETINGWFDQYGTRIASILGECEKSDDFRKKCAVIFPSFSRNQQIGAQVYLRPMPGKVSTSLPKITFREQLSYRMGWRNFELGQLVSTINLAPGETRTISLLRKFVQSVSNSTSLKTVTESSTLDNFENSTEFQKEFTKELNKIQNFSTEGSLDLEIISFGANDSGSDSLKEFSRDFNKSANKAARTLNRKFNQESTIQTSTSSTDTEETTNNVNVTNINKGSTLNINFFQINNKYEGGIFLDDLKLSIRSSIPVIDGSHIYESFLFDLKDMEKGLDLLSVDYVPTRGNLMTSQQKVDLRSHLINFICTALSEYLEGDQARKNYRIEDLREMAKQIELGREPFGGAQPLILPSLGLHADSFVGVLPATEVYAEEMRALEKKKIEVELQKKQAFSYVLMENRNFIMTIIQEQSLTLVFVSKAFARNTALRVFFNNAEVTNASAQVDSRNDRLVKINWNGAQIPSLDELSSNLSLFDNNTGAMISKI